MSQRLNHVRNMIDKFNDPSENGKPAIAPKPVISRKSPNVVEVFPRGSAGSDQGASSLPKNDGADSLEVSSEQPLRTSKRNIEWPPKKRDSDSDDSQESSRSPVEENAHHGDVSKSPVEPNCDGDNSKSPVEPNCDGDNSKSSVEIVIEESNSVNPDASQCSDSTESSVCGDEVDDTSATPPSQSANSKPKHNYAQVTEEIIKTERTFVEDLKALHECYQAMVQVNKERELDLEKRIEDVFSDFVPIYKLHSDTFLPIMERHYAVEEFWVGRVFNDNNFIVKTYKPFIVKQNENEKTLLELLKNPFISEAVAQVLKEHKRMLGCANGYNVIFQRITRYSLLLKEYIKNLPDDCPDRAVAMTAMGKINDAAFQLNETKRNADDFNTQVLNALDRIARGRQLELQPWEKFVKEGPVEKISARSLTRVQTRYLFLFTGRLLICDSTLTTYVIKTQMEVSTMQIEEINDPNKHPNSFRLRGKHKNFDLKFESEEAESDWRDALNRVIAEDRKRRESFMRLGQPTGENKPALGGQAPLWVKDQDCSMCMLCCVEFTFNNRRHHCRACGRCVCGTCSNYKHNLQHVNGKSVRVCKKCKDNLSQGSVEVDEDPSNTIPDALVESYIQFADGTRQFKEKYAILSREGFVELKTRYKDRKAWKTIPIVGFALTNDEEADLCLKLSHPSCEYYFTCKTQESFDKWFASIREVLKDFDC